MEKLSILKYGDGSYEYRANHIQVRPLSEIHFEIQNRVVPDGTIEKIRNTTQQSVNELLRKLFLGNNII